MRFVTFAAALALAKTTMIRVLASGGLPLPVLEAKLNAWIAAGGT